MPTAPAVSPPKITGMYSFQASETILQSKYADANSWAQFAVSLLNDSLLKINNELGLDVIGANLEGALAAIEAIDPYVLTGTLTYNAPTVPTMLGIPTYTEQTLDTLLAIPAVTDIDVGTVPSSTITFTNTAFTDSLLTTLKSKLSTDLGIQSTGLGTAETALFARETARINAARLTAYNEVTSQFSSRGFPMPTGALTAKQTEMNNESSLRLADSSAAIMAESARLAVDYNKAVLSVSAQLMGILGQLFDSNIMRDFEKAKAQVTLSLEGFKAYVQAQMAKGELNKTAITATVEANNGLIQAFLGKIQGQIEPIKAIAGANQSLASMYQAEVQGATADLQAHVIPEELGIKAYGINAQIAESKSKLTLGEAQVVIEAALKEMTVQVSTLQGLAQSACQMVSSAINSVNVSSSFGWQASASDSNQVSEYVSTVTQIQG